MTATTADGGFIAGSALLFAACAAATARWCWSTSPGMAMPGGGSLAAAAAFVGVWAVMMVAMMLPSLLPALLGYRRLLREAHVRRVGPPALLAGVGYFLLWAGAGVVVYLLGVGLMAAEMRWPALAPSVPRAGGVVLLLAGALQLTAWKTRQLERCRMGLLCGRAPSRTGWGACWDGVRYGMHCCLCCAGFMLALLGAGMMDLGAVAGIAALITLERVAGRPEPAVRAAGIVLLAAAALRISPVGELHREAVRRHGAEPGAEAVAQPEIAYAPAVGPWGTVGPTVTDAYRRKPVSSRPILKRA